MSFLNIIICVQVEPVCWPQLVEVPVHGDLSHPPGGHGHPGQGAHAADCPGTLVLNVVFGRIFILFSSFSGDKILNNFDFLKAWYYLFSASRVIFFTLLNHLASAVCFLVWRSASKSRIVSSLKLTREKLHLKGQSKAIFYLRLFINRIYLCLWSTV